MDGVAEHIGWTSGIINCAEGKMLRSMLLGATLVMLCTSSASAMEAGELKEECSHHDQMKCAAYIAGVIDSLRMLSYKTDGGFFCSPQDTTPEKYLSVAATYLAAHPDNMKYNAAGELMVALMLAFPCEPVGVHQFPLPPSGLPPAHN